jgi:hypothetical protein
MVFVILCKMLLLCKCHFLSHLILSLNHNRMKKVKSPLNLCGIFMDTTSYVINFTVVTQEDFSVRSTNMFKKAFHPFFILPTVDIF